MGKRAHLLGSAVFFLAGLAALLTLPWVHHFQLKDYHATEPFFKYPVIVFSGKALLRNDAFGKGAFGVSRNGGRTHKGVDLLTRVGSPVFASKSGRVYYAGEGRGYGQYVEILHPEGASTRYAHLSSIHVYQGQWLEAGDTLGLAGKTGNADSPRILPHLHFEIRVHGQAVDPTAERLDPTILVR